MMPPGGPTPRSGICKFLFSCDFVVLSDIQNDDPIHTLEHPQIVSYFHISIEVRTSYRNNMKTEAEDSHSPQQAFAGNFGGIGPPKIGTKLGP
jgi:hypothetical protein